MNRSLIFVPATDDKLAKIEKQSADCIIIDLEDSIADSDKDNALESVCRYLRSSRTERSIYIRLNSKRYVKEAERLKEFDDIGFMLPKFESTEYYSVCRNIWETHPVIALIETPKGLIRIEDIVKCGWVDAAAFGAEDYTAAVNMRNHPDVLQYQKSMIVTYAKAYSKKAFDTPSFSLNDENAFRYDVDNAVDLGFDGKMLIHPKHTEYINKAFGGSDIETLKRIVDQYESSGQAVAVIDGKVYEKMHISRIKKILHENEA